MDARRGFLKVFFEIAALILAIFCAILLCEKTAQMLKAIFFQVPDLIAQTICFTTVWLIIYRITVFLGESFIRNWRIFPIFELVDLVIGGLLGLLKGLIMSGLIILIVISFAYFSYVPEPLENGLKESWFFTTGKSPFLQSFRTLNHWLLLENDQNPNIFNQIETMINTKKTKKTRPPKKEETTTQPSSVENLIQVVKGLQDLKNSEEKPSGLTFF
jgi:uncharacterized membrane protein required for colicin V production